MFVEPVGGVNETDIFDFRATLETHAKAEGCSHINFVIPKKWARCLPEYKTPRILKSKSL